ncbi:MAG: hypothetical protein K2H34_00050 [Lachnospiraceae bacterium]|nr:hypothetical protein [Lachnospiraceae bacterium]
MKTIYLHIGIPKTGTTSIQNFCSENQAVLNRYGYNYPEFTYRYPSANRLRNAHFLFGCVRNEVGERDYQREEQIFYEGFEQIDRVFEAYDSVILSDEGLWNCAFRGTDNVWERIKQELDKREIGIKVVVYLRRQDDFLYSWWNQRVKEGLKGESQLTWERMADELPIIQLDYYDMLERIAVYVGKSNIVVRRFDTSRFVGGNLYTDFIDAIGLTYSEEYHVKKEQRNISLTQNSNEIKRILNKLPQLDTDNNALFKQILTEQSLYHDDSKGYSMFSETEKMDFLERYREGNIRIAKEYLGEEELFYCDKEERQKWNPENEYMLEDVILFVGSLAMHMERELKEQKRQINGIRNVLKHPFTSIGRKIKMFGR